MWQQLTSGLRIPSSTALGEMIAPGHRWMYLPDPSSRPASRRGVSLSKKEVRPAIGTIPSACELARILRVSARHDRLLAMVTLPRPVGNRVQSSSARYDISSAVPFRSPKTDQKTRLHVNQIGETAKIDSGTEGLFAVDSVQRSGEEVVVHYSLRNLSAGQEAKYEMEAYVIGSDGLIRFCRHISGTDTISSGPSQTAYGVRSFPVPRDLDDLYLVAVLRGS